MRQRGLSRGNFKKDYVAIIITDFLFTNDDDDPNNRSKTRLPVPVLKHQYENHISVLFHQVSTSVELAAKAAKAKSYVALSDCVVYKHLLFHLFWQINAAQTLLWRVLWKYPPASTMSASIQSSSSTICVQRRGPSPSVTFPSTFSAMAHMAPLSPASTRKHNGELRLNICITLLYPPALRLATPVIVSRTARCACSTSTPRAAALATARSTFAFAILRRRSFVC